MNDRIIFELSKAENKIKNHMQKKIKEKGVLISAGQSGVLFLLEKANRLKMSELGRLLKIDNSAITRVVDRLEKNGLVTREPNPDDRRQFLISITDKGRTDIKVVGKVANETNAAIREGFSDEEISVFLRVLSSFSEKF